MIALLNTPAWDAAAAAEPLPQSAQCHQVVPLNVERKSILAVSESFQAISERKPELRLPRAWSHGMRSTESGEKVIQSVFIRQIQDRELQSHVIWLGVKKVIRPNAGVKQVARRDARWIEVVVLCDTARQAT